MNIGVLDDNENICQMIKAVLELRGYTVYTYIDSTDFAASLIPRNLLQFERIIVDFHLAGQFSGVELIRQVRTYYPHLPAVLISASVLPHTLLQDLSYVSVLRKPFPLTDLVRMLTSA